MGDFKRTFGAGADAVSVVDALSRSAARERNSKRGTTNTPANPASNERPQLEQHSCHRCSGSGIIRRYKHIEGGKCFSCNGTGAASVVKQAKFQNRPLYVSLRVVQTLAPKHDSFGVLTPRFRRNYAELISGFRDPNDFRTLVTIGDVAKAFDPCDAIELSLQIRGVDRRMILRMALLAAERAAYATNEPSLLQAVSDARKKIDRKDDTPIIQNGPLACANDSRPVSVAKSCRDFLIRMADSKDVIDPYDVSRFACMAMSQARYVFQAIAQAQGADGREAFEAEKQRQADDVIVISPLSAMRG